eukprot:365876-Chlamydomonas_euryale.AAC.9
MALNAYKVDVRSKVGRREAWVHTRRRHTPVKSDLAVRLRVDVWAGAHDVGDPFEACPPPTNTPYSSGLKVWAAALWRCGLGLRGLGACLIQGSIQHCKEDDGRWPQASEACRFLNPWISEALGLVRPLD